MRKYKYIFALIQGMVIAAIATLVFNIEFLTWQWWVFVLILNIICSWGYDVLCDYNERYDAKNAWDKFVKENNYPNVKKVSDEERKRINDSYNEIEKIKE